MGDRTDFGETIARTLSELGVPSDLPEDHTVRPQGLRRPPAHLPRLSLASSDSADEEADLVVVSDLGMGGMGVVRVAGQRSLSREVALKSLKGSGRPTEIDALLREGVLTGRLEHPNIVPVHQAGWTDRDGPVIVMKRIEGVSWKTLIADEGSAGWADYSGDRLERHLRILIDVCRALEYAHSRSVVHRDVKPSNVMVGRYGEVYLLDWGVAADLSEVEPPNRLAGTPGYMAPEQVPGVGPITEQTDVYLLGATLHAVLVKRARNTGRNVHERLTSAVRAEPFDYRDAPPGLGEIANRACARSPADRHPTVAALRNDVEAFLRHRGAERTAIQAFARLAQLQDLCAEGSPDDPERVLEIHRRFSACKFGFEQALREWSESPGARQGLEDALELMFEHELAAGKPGACALLLADLPRPRPDLQARLDAALQAVDADGEELREIRRQQRFHGVDWGRSIFSMVDGLTVMTLMIGLGWFARGRNFAITPVENTVFLALVMGLQSIVVWFFRREIFETRVFGRMATIIWLAGAVMLLNRLVSMVYPTPFQAVLLADLMILNMGVGMGAVFVSRSLWLTFVLGWVGVIAGAARIEHIFELMGALYVVHAIWIAWWVRPRT